jgi:hypothetical protein
VVGVMNRPLAAADTESDLLLAHREDNFSPVLRRFLEVATEVASEPSAATAAPIAGATSSNA